MRRRPPRSTRTGHTLSLHDALPICGSFQIVPQHRGRAVAIGCSWTARLKREGEGIRHRNGLPLAHLLRRTGTGADACLHPRVAVALAIEDAGKADPRMSATAGSTDISPNRGVGREVPGYHLLTVTARLEPKA